MIAVGQDAQDNLCIDSEYDSWQDLAKALDAINSLLSSIYDLDDEEDAWRAVGYHIDDYSISYSEFSES